MHLRFIVIVFVVWFLYFTRQENFELTLQNRMFNRRRCPPQLDRLVFKCIRQYLIDVPQYIHSQTKDLDLSGNMLTILHESNFANLQHLRKLVLDDNKIWKITQNTFVPLVKLVELSLRNNHLSIDISNSITTKILSPLISLQRLDISYNPLEIIPDDLFINSSNINCLILDSVGSPLRITPQVFINVPKLELLSLEENHLSTLPDNIFKYQTQLDINNIRLSNNPWNCNCSLKWLRHSLDSTIQYNPNGYNTKIPTAIIHKKHNPSCFFPLRWKGFPITQVPLDQFQCKIEIFVYQANITATSGSNSSLVCQFFFVDNDNSTISWFHNNRRIIPSMRIHQYNENLINITSFLNISLLSYRDTGMYQCQINTYREYFKETIYLTVLKSNDEAVMTGIRIIFTIGTVLASLIIFTVSILAVVYLIKHRTVFCSDNSKFETVFHPKNSNREISTNSINPSQVYSTPQSDSSLALLSCSGKEYLSLQRPQTNYSNQPYVFLSKPAFQCTHNRPFIIGQNSNLQGDYSNINGEPICETCVLSENDNGMDPYYKCPIHGQKPQDINQQRIINEPILPMSPTNNSVNINCPLHGYKSENLFYYELSNNYK